jgi:hypothetical protein
VGDKRRVISVDAEGKITSLYDDDFPLPEGKTKIVRASRVEPDPEGGWRVTLTRHPALGSSGGKILARNVVKRRDALSLEVEAVNKILLKKKG